MNPVGDVKALNAVKREFLEQQGMRPGQPAVKSILDDPMLRSRMAIAINNAQKANPARFGKPSMATALSRVREYADSLGSAATPQPALAQ